MADLTSGRYPQVDERYLLHGKKVFRESGDRRYLTSSGLTLTSGTAFVVPVAFQQGDLVKSITIGVKTASATPAHGWAALYTGLTTADTLIANSQSTDDTSGFHGSGSAMTLTLPTAYQVGANPGSTGTDGPVTLGVMLYNEATTGGIVDAYGTGSQAVAGGVFVTGQVPLLFTKSGQSYGATAPANLAGFAAAAAGSAAPYVIVTVQAA